MEIGLHGTQAVLEIGGGALVLLTPVGPVAITVGLISSARGLDHAVASLRTAIDGQEHDTLVHQALVGASDQTASYGETALDVGLILYDVTDGIRSIKKLRNQASEVVEKCGTGPNCFVAGTQVVLRPSNPKTPDSAATILPQTPGDVDNSHDEAFAAGAFALMAGLSYQRRRAKRKRETTQVRLV